MAALQPVQLYVSDYANSNPGQNTVLCNDAVASVDLYLVTSYYIYIYELTTYVSTIPRR